MKLSRTLSQLPSSSPEMALRPRTRRASLSGENAQPQLSQENLAISFRGFARNAMRLAAEAFIRATSRSQQSDATEISLSDVLESLEPLQVTGVAATSDTLAVTVAAPLAQPNSLKLQQQARAQQPPIGSVMSNCSLETIEATPNSSCADIQMIPLGESFTEQTIPEEEFEDEYDEDLPEITLEEVSQHYTETDAWMVIYDKVYDVTDFLAEHPGGLDVMLEYCGLDASVAFRSVGHSPDAMEMLRPYLLGILPKKERMYENSPTFLW